MKEWNLQAQFEKLKSLYCFACAGGLKVGKNLSHIPQRKYYETRNVWNGKKKPQQWDIVKKKSIPLKGNQHPSLSWWVRSSINPSNCGFVIGGILISEQGECHCCFSCPIPPMDSNEAWVLVIHRAIQISINNPSFNSRLLKIETDSSAAVNWCSQQYGGPHNLTFILNFIRSTSTRKLQVAISHNSINSLMVSRMLAEKNVHRSSDLVTWM